LRQCGLSLRDRLVLDVGCNLGMMIGVYLRLGAGWCHGWDRKNVTPHTESLLLGIGCTRFSLTGRDITSDIDLVSDLPAHLHSRLNGCVISYLSISGHIGWLQALSQINWSMLILEGHENENLDAFDNNIRQLRAKTAFRVAMTSSIKDGDSAARHFAILTR
jgi:hypothetical protein